MGEEVWRRERSARARARWRGDGSVLRCRRAALHQGMYTRVCVFVCVRARTRVYVLSQSKPWQLDAISCGAVVVTVTAERALAEYRVLERRHASSKHTSERAGAGEHE